MAQFGKDIDNVTASTSVKIIAAEPTETHTIYVVEVTIGPYSWQVRHRYNDFYELHEKLCSSCKLDKNLLPPKKLFGNQSESFIKKRQHDLEVYLQTVIHFVSHKMPICLAAFLEFDQYEIHGITQVMAEDLYDKGDALLQTRELYRTTPLHLYALTERLKLPEPTCESGDVKRDLGHILDFITRLKCLQVCGGKKVGNSNIEMNNLQFDLTLFKSLQKLELLSVSIGLIGGLDTVKQTLQTLSVNKSVSAIREVLLQDLPQWKADDGTLLVSYWDSLTHVDFSFNSVTEIDDTVQLMPKVVRLDLSHNKIGAIKHLQWLSHMTYLDMSYNDIKELEALHSKLGNLKTLKLAGNKLHSLQGLSKLFSLEHLDLSYNQISSVEDIRPINRLPCVEQLLLIGNPVTITLDYRTKTLALFGDRVSEICLDKVVTSEKELDTVKVLQAIQKSKDKAKEINIKKASSGASLSDLHHTPSSSSLGGYHGDTITSGNQVSQDAPLLQKYSLYVRPSNTGRGSVTNTVQSLHIDTSDAGLHSSLHVDPSSQLQNQPLPAHDLDSGLQQLQRISSARASSTSSVSSASETHYVNIASLPDHKNSDFLSWLHARLFGPGTDSDEPVEQIKYVFWCVVVQYSNQDSLLPCCVVLTERRLFILQLKSKDLSIQDVPAMETFYILPLCNIQQVLTGLCYSYIRLEESFVGSSGTFALIATESDIGKEFFEVLKSCVESNPENGELDVINGIQDSDLSKQIYECEEGNGECTGRVALAAYVTETETGSKAFLVLSENHVYIFKSCVLFWPKPTFDLNKIETERRFEIAQQFNVEAKISEINKYKVSGATSAKENEKYQSGSHVTAVPAIRYQEFGLSMVFHESLGSHGFDFQFLSSKVRDSFLDQLTSLRSEHAHRMSPTLRQEPEGGNESSDGSEDRNAPKDEDSRDEGINQVTDEDCDGSDSDIVGDTISVESFGKRKLRSKTEVIITRKSVPMSEEEQHLPSYTLHYLTPELISHLESSVKRYTLFQPLSAKLQSICEMNGQTLAEFFHKNIVPVGHDSVELHDIIWTNVIPYTNPKDEIVTCVMLSNRAVYFVSDRPVRLHQATGRPSWMTHARHVSDSIIGLQSKEADRHHSSGILHLSQSTEPIVKPYCVLDFADIRQINVGLFDQCVRLTGDKRETVFTLVTRNSEMTSLFMKNLSTMLSLYIASPMLESSSSDLEQDFYKAFNKRTKTTVEGIEYIHPSRVKFCYPGDEAISDLLFLINEHLKTASFKVGRENILQYIAGFKTQSQNKGITSILLEPISIILTNECLCLVTEDLVSYPLPDFVRGLPSMPRQHVTDVKKIEYLKHLKLNHSDPRDITLVFSDEKEDIVLVPDHYSLKDTRNRDTAPEIPVRLLIQSEREMNKFTMLIKSQWKDLHPDRDGELPVF